jgi:hypothetical protein
VQELATLAKSSGGLRFLTSLTITLPASGSFSRRKYFNGLLKLLTGKPLREIQISRPGGEISISEVLPEGFVDLLLREHGQRLTKFAVQKLETSATSIRAVCRHCPNLEQFFFALGKYDFVRRWPLHLCQIRSRRRRTFSVNNWDRSRSFTHSTFLSPNQATGSSCQETFPSGLSSSIGAPRLYIW